MSVTLLDPVQPGEGDAATADVALAQVADYLTRHPHGPAQVRLRVEDVSRPHLIGLLEAGEIDYHKVGKHRRIKVSSLLAYMRADDRRRRAAADELSALTQDMDPRRGLREPAREPARPGTEPAGANAKAHDLRGSRLSCHWPLWC
jgi:excisionase family DNA binding protein